MGGKFLVHLSHNKIFAPVTKIQDVALFPILHESKSMHVRCPAPLHSCQRREKEITLITTIRYLFRLDLEIILHLPSPREGEPETVKSHGRQSSLHSDIIITSSEVECFNRNNEWETSSLS